MYKIIYELNLKKNYNFIVILNDRKVSAQFKRKKMPSKGGKQTPGYLE